jgi:hypothetical protein
LSIRSWSFDCYRFTEAHPFRRFFSFPAKGKLYLHTIVVLEAAAKTATLVAMSASHAGKLLLSGDALRSIPRLNQEFFVNVLRAMSARGKNR